ncbi:hypothetical protein ACOTTU_24390, partial [Roseobacter sp. EG26]|uniref:hypothetical protein n=1 Tax=Roseobacter sp. EG26 TaxID=3412477 RepID=UPI003CE57039
MGDHNAFASHLDKAAAIIEQAQRMSPSTDGNAASCPMDERQLRAGKTVKLVRDWNRLNANEFIQNPILSLIGELRTEPGSRVATIYGSQ